MRYHVLTSELIRTAGHKARLFGHSYVGSVHLLTALVELPSGTGQFLRSMGLDPCLTETMARLFYGMGRPDLPLPQGLTANARKILHRASREAKSQNSRLIRPVHVLLALARTENCGAAELLMMNGISPQGLFSHTVE